MYRNNELKNYFFITVGAAIMSAGINIFYVPNEIVSGGVSGIGIILMYYTNKYIGFSLPVSITNIILNLPLFIFAYRYFGKKYIERSVIGAVIFSLTLEITSIFNGYSGDLMLASIFGGILVGTGVGIVLNGSATTGGTETAAHILHYKNDIMSVSNYIFAIDAAIILAGLFAFGAEKAMFSIIAVFAASKCISAVSSGASTDKAAIIVSKMADKISREIKNETGRTITELNDCGGINGISLYKTLVCVFSQKELMQIKEIVKKSDSFAFIIIFDIKDVYGGGFKKL
ncbi:hypothetical protein IMSAG049_01624 [Clostridiales bacterium]|nr:hypothetical protein IMSAG049_01624 [Clostridiales bacterium]